MKKTFLNAAKTGGMALLAACCLLTACNDNGEEENRKTIRIGHFPNITHVQALVARNMERNGNDWFAKYIPGYKLEWYVFNAGPSAMNAVFARSIDLTYVGPSPAINAFSKSRGSETRIVSGAVNGASALVVRPGRTFENPADFLGSIIATQDVSCRAWLKQSGFNVTMGGAKATDAMKAEKNFKTPSNGVDIAFMPMGNSEILMSFTNKRIDAAWTVEPWISRMINEAGGKIFIEEDTAVTTVLAARVKWMEKNPELLTKIVKAHQDLTQWIIDHPEESQKMVAEELSALTKTAVSPELIASAWKRLILTNDVSRESLESFVKSAQEGGLIGSVPPLDQLIVTPLN